MKGCYYANKTVFCTTFTCRPGCPDAGLCRCLGGGRSGPAIYATGDLKTVVSKDINSVYQAAQKSLEQLQLRATTKVKDALAAKIIARDAQDKKITIKFTSTTEDTTKLSIRVGLFGNETKSRLIYEQIRKNLD